jgi:predicted SAM-dependent methyltransferase
MPKTKLREHYPELVDFDLVEVDVIDDGEKLSTFEMGSLDFIIANHFIEHCQNPLGTIESFSRVLRPDGVIYMAVPNKRYTFDKNREATSVEHLIQDFRTGSQQSRDHHFREWVTLVEPHFGRVYQSEAEITARVDSLSEMDYSIHFHCWEPSDFLEMLVYCARVSNHSLTVQLFTEISEEMITILKKSGGASAEQHVEQ